MADHASSGGKDLQCVIVTPEKAVLDEAAERRCARRLEAQGLADGRGDEIRVGDRLERREEDAAWIDVDHLGRQLERQPGLAGATRAGEAQ